MTPAWRNCAAHLTQDWNNCAQSRARTPTCCARNATHASEMRERVGNLLEEQRVCFKQLSLEAGESASAHERARRQIEARIEALEKSDE